MEESRHFKMIFKRYEINNGVVNYLINLSCENDSSINFDFKDRYSRLKELHDAFRKEADSLNFPKFPPKKMFGNLEEKFLSERKIKLQHYFNTILGSKDFSKLKTLKIWIDELIVNFNKTNKTLNKSENEKNKSKENLPNLNKSIGNSQDNNTSSKLVSSPKNQNGILY
jgi:hypothetical protein